MVFLRYVFGCVFIFATAASAELYNEAEFEQLRAEIRNASAQSPLHGISVTDNILAEHDKKLSTRQKIRLLYGKAWFQIQTDNIERAIVTLSLCKQMSDDVSDPTILFSYYSLKAGALTRMSMYERALENYLESYRLAGLMDTDLFLRQTENNIGNVYLKLGRYDDAIIYFERFYVDAKGRNLPQQMGVGLNNMGEVLFGQQNYQAALDYHLQSLAIREHNDLTYHSSWSHHNLGKTYLVLEQLDKAEHHLQTAIQIRKQNSAIADSIGPQIDLIKVHMHRNGEEKIEALLQDVIDLSGRHGRLQEQSEAYQLLVGYYQQQQDWKRALEVSDLFMRAKFDFLQKQTETGVAFYAAQMNLAIKERDIAELTKENELFQIHTQAAKTQLFLVITSSLLIALLTLFFVRRIKTKNQALTKTLENLQTTQKQLLESEKMSAMTTLVQGMAHQLNTPLGLVVTSASCLEDKLKDIRELLLDHKLSAKQLKVFLEDAAQMLEMTANNASRSADLIARFKMISASLDKSEAVDFDVLKYLKERCKLLSQSVPEEVEIEVYGESVDVHSHPETLLKVISHLVDNSCAHGFVEGRHGKVEIEISEENQDVIIFYQDNGVGITEEQQLQMFDPFYTSQLGQGKLGLGLNIVYNSVVQVLKGEIKYENVSGGAKFVIRIPKGLE